MIVYKDMAFCAREGCPVKTCPRNLVHVDWSQELPVSLSDFWKKRSECPAKEPRMMEFKYDDDEP